MIMNLIETAREKDKSYQEIKKILELRRFSDRKMITSMLFIAKAHPYLKDEIIEILKRWTKRR